MQNHQIYKTYGSFINELNTAGFGIQETATNHTPDMKYKTRLRIKKKEHEIKEGDPLWKRVYKAHPAPVLLGFIAFKVGASFLITHYVIPKFFPKQMKQVTDYFRGKFIKGMNNFKKFNRLTDERKRDIFETTRKWLDGALIGSSLLGAAYLYTTEQYDFYFERMMEGIDKEIKTVKNIGKKKVKQ